MYRIDDGEQEAVGRRVLVDGRGEGRLEYFGVPVFARDAGAWVGVALDDPCGHSTTHSFTRVTCTAGVIDGEYGGFRYFACAPEHGVMLPVKANTVHVIVEDVSDDYDDASVLDADTFEMVEAPQPDLQSAQHATQETSL